MVEEISGEEISYRHRLDQAEALEKAGINPYPAEPPRITHKNIKLVRDFDVLNETEVSVVGRIVAMRGHGGLIFSDLEDETGKIQVMVTKNGFGQERFGLIKDNFGEGDFVNAIGVLGKTRTEEITIRAQEFNMLAKTLRQAPLKLNDPEVQQRQRYIHTLVDPNAREVFRTRSKIVQAMRNYFIDNLGCLEVETPILDNTYGGASARPFRTYHNALSSDVYLRISNELYLKRYTVGGYYEGVFEFSRDFRNEGMDRTHNPEFTQVEMYKPYWDYNNMMDMTEDLISNMVLSLYGKTETPYGDQMIDYKKPWRRLTVYDGLRERLGIEPTTISESALKEIAKEYKIEGYAKGDLIMGLFEETWEKDLIQPTFVLDYPADTSALTKRHRIDPELTERFEVYVAGMEVGNCYTELNDPRDQRKRFEEERRRQTAGDKEAMPFDEDFIIAQEYGMPQQAGIGISIDRFTMLLTNTAHIRNAIYFPTLKVKG